MGIKVQDANGNLKSSDQLLKEVAGKFAGYQDGAAKAALAQELFGRSGAELMPLLNAGAEGISAIQGRPPRSAWSSTRTPVRRPRHSTTT